LAKRAVLQERLRGTWCLSLSTGRGHEGKGRMEKKLTITAWGFMGEMGVAPGQGERWHVRANMAGGWTKVFFHRFRRECTRERTRGRRQVYLRRQTPERLKNKCRERRDAGEDGQTIAIRKWKSWGWRLQTFSSTLFLPKDIVKCPKAK